MSKQVRVWTGTQWDTLAVTLPDLSNYSTTTQMNTAIDNAKGLVLVSSTTIGSAVASVTINNCFSSTYDNYRIVIGGGTSSGALYFNLSGITSGYYYNAPYSVYGGALTARGGSNTSNVFVGDSTNSTAYLTLELYNPNLAKPKAGVWQQAVTLGGFDNASTTQATGFVFSASSMTGGTIRVYGYRNS